MTYSTEIRTKAQIAPRCARRRRGGADRAPLAPRSPRTAAAASAWAAAARTPPTDGQTTAGRDGEAQERLRGSAGQRSAQGRARDRGRQRDRQGQALLHGRRPRAARRPLLRLLGLGQLRAHRRRPARRRDALGVVHGPPWGKGGKGRWITTYANEGHIYAVIAGPAPRHLDDHRRRTRLEHGDALVAAATSPAIRPASRRHQHLEWTCAATARQNGGPCLCRDQGRRAALPRAERARRRPLRVAGAACCCDLVRRPRRSRDGQRRRRS